jgi:hypothetical protein
MLSIVCRVWGWLSYPLFLRQLRSPSHWSTWQAEPEDAPRRPYDRRD